MAKETAKQSARGQYTSKRAQLADIRRRVDKLNPNQASILLEVPEDHSDPFQVPDNSTLSTNRYAEARRSKVKASRLSKNFHAFDGSFVDPLIEHFEFVEKTKEDKTPVTKGKVKRLPGTKAKKTSKKKTATKAKTVAKPAAKKAAAKKSGSAKAKPAKKAAKTKRSSSPKISKPAANKLEPQCKALTSNGLQCRNSSRHGSAYCASHKGYHPKSAKQVDRILHGTQGGRHSKATITKEADTVPRKRGARDTKPAVRKKSSRKK